MDITDPDHLTICIVFGIILIGTTINFASRKKDN